MGVIQSNYLEDGLTPICNECGIALCFDIDKFEYEQIKVFWDNWKCEDCNPDVRGSRKRYLMEHEII